MDFFQAASSFYAALSGDYSTAATALVTLSEAGLKPASGKMVAVLQTMAASTDGVAATVKAQISAYESGCSSCPDLEKLLEKFANLKANEDAVSQALQLIEMVQNSTGIIAWITDYTTA